MDFKEIEDTIVMRTVKRRLQQHRLSLAQQLQHNASLLKQESAYCVRTIDKEI